MLERKVRLKKTVQRYDGKVFEAGTIGTVIYDGAPLKGHKIYSGPNAVIRFTDGNVFAPESILEDVKDPLLNPNDEVSLGAKDRNP